MERFDLEDETRQCIGRVERAIAAIRAGRMVILTDDEDRENEGDLVLAAAKVTPEAINFMATHARGLICLTLTEARARQLNLPLMVQDNGSQFKTAFTVSVEAARGVSTGISAQDRAKTVKVAVAPSARPTDLVRPGHIFPLVAREGGVLVRTGQTEGSVDLARLAGLTPAGVICEIMKPDGSMARRPDLERFAKKHKLVLLSVADLIRYRLEREHLVTRVEQSPVDIRGLGRFLAVRYRSAIDGREHVALVRGEVAGARPVLVRVHSPCLMSDTLLATGCDCGSLLRRSLEAIAREDRGVLVYVQRGEELRLGCSHQSHARLDEGQSRLRELGVGAQILRELGVQRIRVLTNHPRRIVGAQGYGLSVVDRVPIELPDTLPAPPKARGRGPTRAGRGRRVPARKQRRS